MANALTLLVQMQGAVTGASGRSRNASYIQRHGALAGCVRLVHPDGVDGNIFFPDMWMLGWQWRTATADGG